MERKIQSSNEFFDILDKLPNNAFVSIGYVTGANLNVPTIKKKNPATNRMKSYPDYSTFKKEGFDSEIGALVKITTYNFRYYNRQAVGQKYGEYKKSVNQIRSEYGIDPVQDRESYKSATGWSDKAPEVYTGKRDDLASHSYNPQNMYGAKTKSVVYAVDTEGHIVRELAPEEVKPYLKAKREPDGVAALRKMGADEERIKQFIERIKELKFSYKNFESNSILWRCATVDGEKVIYINDKMNRVVDEINIRPEDFRKIARERYKLSLDMFTENKKRNVVRLTESQVRQIVTESVKRILKEMNDTDDDFICHGCKAWSNWGGIEMQISDGGDEARLRYPDGEITDWLEIEYDEEGVAYITAPNGEIERFDEYERVG